MPSAVIQIEINGDCECSSISIPVSGNISTSDTYIESQHLYIAVVHMAPLELGLLVSDHRDIEDPWMGMVDTEQPRPDNHAGLLSLCSDLVGYSYSLRTQVRSRNSGSTRIEYY